MGGHSFESFCGKWKQKILLKSPYVSECCLCPLNEVWEGRSPLGHHLNVCLYSETILQRDSLVALSSVGCQMTMTTGFLEVQLLGHSFTEGSRFRNALLRDLKKGLLVIWSLCELSITYFQKVFCPYIALWINCVCFPPDFCRYKYTHPHTHMYIHIHVLTHMHVYTSIHTTVLEAAPLKK